jgi:NAD(P)H-flavin reductase
MLEYGRWPVGCCSFERGNLRWHALLHQPNGMSRLICDLKWACEVTLQGPHSSATPWEDVSLASGTPCAL